MDISGGLSQFEYITILIVILVEHNIIRIH